MIESVYLNLEDDVAKIVARVKKAHGDKVVLVCPKRCQLFSDSINLRLLKKQTDLLGKKIAILTMDEKGQMFAKEAGFTLKFLPKAQGVKGFSDIRIAGKKATPVSALQEESTADKILDSFKGGLSAVADKIIFQEKSEHASLQGVQPEKLKKQEAVKFEMTENVFPKEIHSKLTEKKIKEKKSGQRALVGLVALSILLVLTVVFVILPSATVNVHPKTEPVTRDLEISAGGGVSQADASRLVLPATLVDEVLESSKKFQSQGKKEVGNKATGFIKIYNFTGQPINLKQGTTVISVGDKSYNLNFDIVLHPTTQYVNEQTKEVDQGTLGEPYEIIALEGGESYNLPEGTRMEITNQVFGSRPQLLYARTQTAIVGGTSRYLAIISEEDVLSAEEELVKELLQNLNSKLSSRNLILVEGAYQKEVISFETDKVPGTESPSFTASIKITIKGLAINNQQMQKLVTDRITQTLSAGKRLESPDWNLANIRVKNLNLETGLVSFLVHFEAKSASEVNLEQIKPELVGKSLGQVNEILESRPEIERIDVNLTPIWQKNFPWLSSKIKLILSDN
ncbi:MAG: hypothetical protein COT92_02800 [Candidatus Doudnabacteria bacterium CG10_big_fil_rev_8_21_14_0_10_42_18]|uniref:Baseplate protein J-like domain-containing protein n=1 Tax=Candidatus Doudnabacteria bacterium CG10_big_fil_rev_8_21_14_0_10_42_18 TaxID=1974552 RepID=A0A2H0VCM4_9BACT|nr:MAG: hypothetical protein COT92_02800 [Candidatus Doudnabacteria bacterium CG10_big_fil_rev_8_21_14_0_10_42_18]